MDQQEILRRLALPATVMPYGVTMCPVCEEATQSLGPHMLKHWKEADYSPGNPKQKHKCPDCDKMIAKGGLRSHLVDSHRWDKETAAAFERVAGMTPGYKQAGDRGVSGGRKAALERVRRPKEKTKEKPEEKPSFDPTDMALAVIMSQANGSVPTAALPEIIAYVDHTRAIVETLRTKP